MRAEPGIADAGAGAPDPARDEDADADNNSDGTGDAVVIIFEGALGDLDLPAAHRALDALVLGRWPQLMHAYSGCSHAHGSESPPGSGRTGTSLTAADARRRLAMDDVWSRLPRCCLLGEGSDHSTRLRLLGVTPELSTIFVSVPVKSTTPITHRVFRRTVPRRRIMLVSTACFFPSCVTTAALSLYRLVSGRSHSTWNEFCLLAHARAESSRVSGGHALRLPRAPPHRA